MTVSDLAAIVGSGLTGAPVAFDTETDGHPVWAGAKLRLVSISNGIATVVLNPIEHGRTLQTLLTKPYNWVAFNAKFDKAIIRNNLGIDMKGVTDVAIMAHLIDSRGKHQGGPGQSLADLSVHYLDEVKESDELKAEMKLGKWTWETIPLDNPVYVRYAAKDAALTARLYAALSRYRPSPELMLMEHRVADVCSEMEARGFEVDVDFATRKGLELRQAAATGQVRAAELGLKNINSSLQVRAALGTLDAQKGTLEALAVEGSELAAVVTAAKRAGKWAGTYTAAFLAAGDRVHASIRPLGTRTGRMSSSDPNLQNIPKGVMRNCLCAPEGGVIWSADFQGVEVRVLAALCRDETLIGSIIGGRSLHDETARAIFGENYTAEQRTLAKVGVFATLYGAGWKALMEQLKVDEGTARAVHGGLFKAFPGARSFDRRMRAEAEKNGFIHTRGGRRLYVDRDKSYTATNYAIQGTAAELFKVSLLQAVDAGLGDYLLAPVHDELVGWAPAAEGQEVLGRVIAAMATELDGVPITANGKVGGRGWGTLYQKGA